METIRELLSQLEKASTKEYDSILKKISNVVLSDEFKEKVVEAPFSDIVSLISVLSTETFNAFVNKYKEIIINKINDGQPKDFGALFEGLTKEKRKIWSRLFRGYVSKKFGSFSLHDVIHMLYNVTPAAREIVVNQYKEIMMQPSFAEKIIRNLDIFGEFLSLLPESIRNQLIRRHQNVFLNSTFIEKLKKLDSDVRASILRWLPMELAKKVVEAMKNAP